MSLVEQYRNAVAMKSRAEEYLRTAVQHIDKYEAWYRLQFWKEEVQKLLSEIRLTVL